MRGESGKRARAGKQKYGRGSWRNVQKGIHCHSESEGFQLLFSKVLIFHFKTDLIQTKTRAKMGVINDY